MPCGMNKLVPCGDASCGQEQGKTQDNMSLTRIVQKGLQDLGVHTPPWPLAFFRTPKPKAPPG